MQQDRIRGLVAATHTPFHEDGSLNLAAVELQAAHLLRTRITAAFISGTTGECHSLTLAERLSLTDKWTAVARGTPLRVVVHVGSNCLEDARALAASAERCGASAIAALAPSYFRPQTLEDLVAWCARIAEAAPGTPFYYYDIPSMTGVHFPMTDFLDHAAGRIPVLAGIKFSNPDLAMFQRCLHLSGGTFDVLWGVDEYLLAALALGGQGAVGSTYNFAAPLYHRMIEAFHRGDMQTARAEQYRSVELITLLESYGFMGSSKALMKMLGVNVGPARPPQGNLSADQLRRLSDELGKCGFFEWTAASA
ncbi:MAG: dihydrodipicolinate synthase family protein [Acidobacteria bacterium]|nr:dihydrodipicolinate synthase family protein [Acidobacteriota bacterium]